MFGWPLFIAVILGTMLVIFAYEIIDQSRS